MRNPRRAYDQDGREIAPMTLANMRENGTRSVEATRPDPHRHGRVGWDSNSCQPSALLSRVGEDPFTKAVAMPLRPATTLLAAH